MCAQKVCYGMALRSIFMTFMPQALGTPSNFLDMYASSSDLSYRAKDLLKSCFRISRDILLRKKKILTFPACFFIQIFFSNLNLNCSNLSAIRNLQEHVKKAFCYQKLFWPFTVWINCSSELKKFPNSWPRISKVFLYH